MSRDTTGKDQNNAPAPALGWVRERAATYAKQPFLICDEGEFLYGDLLDEVEGAFRVLKEKGIEPGEVVALRTDFSVRGLGFFLALLENGNVVVPISSSIEEEVSVRLDEGYAQREIRFCAGATEVQKRPELEKMHPLIEGLRERKRAGLILFTSGSTGKPKAMLHDATTLLKSYEGGTPKHLRVFAFLVFDHIGGMDTLFRALKTVSTLIVSSRRDPETIASLIERHKVEVLPASPTFLNLFLLSGVHERHDLGTLRIIGYGAEPMPAFLLKKLVEAFPRVQFQQKFGTSETNAVAVSSQASNSLFFKMRDANIQHRIVDGELWLKSRTQILGYLNGDTESSDSEGWFRTGDVVEENEEGFLRIVGRLNEVINVGGEKVYPGEVEAVLLEIPDVLDCLVRGIPNAITGQAVVADIVPKTERTPLEMKREIRKFCRDRIEAYKIPVKVNLVEKTNFGSRFKKIRSQPEVG